MNSDLRLLFVNTISELAESEGIEAARAKLIDLYHSAGLTTGSLPRSTRIGTIEGHAYNLCAAKHGEETVLRYLDGVVPGPILAVIAG